MKKTYFVLAILLVLAVVTAYAIIENAYSYSKENKLELVVLTFNHGSSIKDASLDIYIPELNVLERDSGFRIRSGKSVKTYFETDLPGNIKPDYYPVIIMLNDEDGSIEKKHTWVYISK